MKPDPATLEQLTQDVSASLVREHVERLEDDYFTQFSPAQIAAHLQAIASLSSEHRVAALIDREDDGEVHCTVITVDRPGAFAVLTGLLASSGFRIASGDIFGLSS